VEKFPESFGNLLHLEQFQLCESKDYVHDLKVLSNALCKLEQLKVLQIYDLHFLERLPRNLDCFFSLQFLFIYECTILVELPSSTGNLS